MIDFMQKDKLRDAFSKRLIEALDDLGVPVRERTSTLARWLGKSSKNPEFARKWMKGLSMPQKDNMTVISEKLGVRVEWLEYGVGEKTPEQNPENFGRISEPTNGGYNVSQRRKDLIDKAMKLNESDYAQLVEFARYLLWKKDQR